MKEEAEARVREQMEQKMREEEAERQRKEKEEEEAAFAQLKARSVLSCLSRQCLGVLVDNVAIPDFSSEVLLTNSHFQSSTAIQSWSRFTVENRAPVFGGGGG